MNDILQKDCVLCYIPRYSRGAGNPMWFDAPAYSGIKVRDLVDVRMVHIDGSSETNRAIVEDIKTVNIDPQEEQYEDRVIAKYTRSVFAWSDIDKERERLKRKGRGIHA